MGSNRLTEKNMANKLFYKNEQAIFIAYYKLKDYRCSKKIARRAGISRATFYRHHKTAHNIPSDYEEYLFTIYSRRFKKYLHNNSFNLKNTYLRFLVFIMSNKKIFRALFNEERKDIIKKMVHLLKPQIIASWGITGNLDRIFIIYESTILGIIEVWSGENFSNKTLTKALDSIIYLTQNACRDLLPLKKLTKAQADPA